MGDPERFKRQAPVTKDSPVVKCLEEETAIGPCENKS